MASFGVEDACLRKFFAFVIDQLKFLRVLQGRACNHYSFFPFFFMQANSKSFVVRTLDRKTLWEMQTPQVMRQTLHFNLLDILMLNIFLHEIGESTHQFICHCRLSSLSCLEMVLS